MLEGEEDAGATLGEAPVTVEGVVDERVNSEGDDVAVEISTCAVRGSFREAGEVMGRRCRGHRSVLHAREREEEESRNERARERTTASLRAPFAREGSQAGRRRCAGKHTGRTTAAHAAQTQGGARGSQLKTRLKAMCASALAFVEFLAHTSCDRQ